MGGILSRYENTRRADKMSLIDAVTPTNVGIMQLVGFAGIVPSLITTGRAWRWRRRRWHEQRGNSSGNLHADGDGHDRLGIFHPEPQRDAYAESKSIETGYREAQIPRL
jgi:hypothetical protein